MKTRNRTTASVLGAALAIALSGLACVFDTSALLGPVTPTLTAEPNPACPGEPVTITWDLNLPEGPEWCFCFNGARRPDPIACVSSDDCPDPETCLGGYCCNLEVCGTECGNPGDSCKADFEAQLEFDASTTPITNETGTHTFIPAADTTVTLSGTAIGAGLMTLTDQMVTIDVLDPLDDHRIPLVFPWICGTPNWEGVTTPEREFVRIGHVENTGPYILTARLKRVGEELVIIEPFELDFLTVRFGGVFAGDWNIEPFNPSDVFVPIPVECPPSITASDRLPDLVLELTLMCVTP